LLNYKHPSATDNRLKTTSLHRFVRKKRRRPLLKAAVVMGKEVSVRSSDERQVCSPLMARMACPGFAIPANTAPKPPIPGRREAAAIGWHRAKLAAYMRGAPLADIYYIDALTTRPGDVRDDVPLAYQTTRFLHCILSRADLAGADCATDAEAVAMMKSHVAWTGKYSTARG
jgi:hypothetical protein